MQLFRHWVRIGDEIETPRGKRAISCVGWSNDDEAHARTMAAEKLSRLRQRFSSGDFQKRENYAYTDGRPLQEEIVQEETGADGSTRVVITRNAYGALVLNTDRVLFIDLDFESLPDTRSFWQRLIGRRSDPFERALIHVQQVNERYLDSSFRIYRTLKGLRLVLLNRTVNVADPLQLEVLRAFGSDPMYVKLCEVQKSFRARLTPKPWRVGVGRPPARFPFADEPSHTRYQAWVRRYEDACQRYSTVQHVNPGAEPRPVEAVARVLALHDAFALRPGLPLA